MEDAFKKIGLLVLIIGVLSFSSLFIALVLSFASSSPLEKGNVAVIPLSGTISFSDDFWGDTVHPDTARKWIEEADKDPKVKVIVLEINSPGGSAVASDEIAQAVARANKTVIAWIRQTGASGSYWIASNADYIIANRMSITGSVGVTGSYLEFGGTLQRYNATYQEFTGGDYKEVGTPFREPTPQERALYQDKIDLIHKFFLESVVESRNLSVEASERVATGEFLLGVEAKELGLVDELGGKPELDAYLKNILGEEPKYVHYRKPRGLLEEFGMLRSPSMPFVREGLEIRT